MAVAMTPFGLANTGAFLDFGLAFVGAGDNSNQVGGQFAFGTAINDNITIKTDMGYSMASIDYRLPTERTYSYMFGEIGAEYLYPIFPKYRLKIGADFLAGVSFVDTKFENSENIHDKGFRYKGSVIGVVDITQRLSFVLSVGYQGNSFYGDYMDTSVAGVNIVGGIRVNLFGVNRDLESSY